MYVCSLSSILITNGDDPHVDNSYAFVRNEPRHPNAAAQWQNRVSGGTSLSHHPLPRSSETVLVYFATRWRGKFLDHIFPGAIDHCAIFATTTETPAASTRTTSTLFCSKNCRNVGYTTDRISSCPPFLSPRDPTRIFFLYLSDSTIVVHFSFLVQMFPEAEH